MLACLQGSRFEPSTEVTELDIAMPSFSSSEPDEGSILAEERAAFRALMKGATGPPSAMATVTDCIIAGVQTRRYKPLDSRPGTLVFIHGGGWVVGDADSYDGFARALASGTGRQVVSVDYRLAPEHPYPAAVEDCVAVTQALLLDTLAGPLALCGDSAGGALAAVVANENADSWSAGPPAIVAQALFYPATDLTGEPPSLEAFKDDPALTRDAVRRCRALYAPSPHARAEPRASPLLAPAETLRLAPPTYVLVAARDVLRDEGVAYAQALARAGVDVTAEIVPGMRHGFAARLGKLPEAREAVARVCAWLRDRWDAAAATAATVRAAAAATPRL